MEVNDIPSLDNTDTSLNESSINDFTPESSPVDNSLENEDGQEDHQDIESTTGETSENESFEDDSNGENLETEPSIENPVNEDLPEENEFSLATSSNVEELPEDDLIAEQLFDTENLFFTKDFANYTVEEGLLLLIFVILLFKFCIDLMYKMLHWRMF